MDPHRRDGAGTSPGSSATRFAIKRYSSPRKLSLLSFSSTSSASEEPLLFAKGDENQTLTTPRLDSSPSSATVIAHNEDLLTQILLFLPPKSLLRFQSVSKRWLSIISNPVFRRLHCRKYPSSALSFFLLPQCYHEPPLSFICLRQEDVKSMGTITSRLLTLLGYGEILSFASCNGLLCIVSLDCGFDFDNLRFIVYNPTTNQHRIIFMEKSEEELFEAVNIVFDPSKSYHYKLVCVLVVHEHYEFKFRVYSSETGIWSEIAETFVHDDGDWYYFAKGVFWNGDLHWIGVLSGTLCFDLDNERLRPVISHTPNPNPSVERERRDICYFGESGEHLYFIRLETGQAMLWKVFSLKRDYSGWVVKYSIDVAPLVTLYPSVLVEESNKKHLNLHMPCFVVDEKEKKAMLVILLEREVISYDINDLTVKELAKACPSYVREREFEAPMHSVTDTVPHSETLACI